MENSTTQAATALKTLNTNPNTPWDIILNHPGGIDEQSFGVLYGDNAADFTGEIVFEDDSVITWDDNGYHVGAQ